MNTQPTTFAFLTCVFDTLVFTYLGSSTVYTSASAFTVFTMDLWITDFTVRGIGFTVITRHVLLHTGDFRWLSFFSMGLNHEFRGLLV